jgi:hypothetical protein
MLRESFHDPLVLLKEIIAHPNAVELLPHAVEFVKVGLEIRQFQDSHLSSPQLVKKASATVERRGIVNPPVFEGMTNDQIQVWLERWDS